MTTPLQVQMQRRHMNQTTTMILSRRAGPVVYLHDAQDVLDPMERYGFNDGQLVLAWASGALIEAFDYVTAGRTRGRAIEMSFVDLHNLQKFLKETI